MLRRVMTFLTYRSQCLPRIQVLSTASLQHVQRLRLGRRPGTRRRAWRDRPASAPGRARRGFRRRGRVSVAFGMVTITPCRSSQASATCAGRRTVARRPPRQRRCPSMRALLDRRIGHDRYACACGTTAAGRIRCRAGSGCRAPGWSRQSLPPGSAESSCMSSMSKLLTPQSRILPAARNSSKAATVSAAATRRANAADRGRCGRSSAASGCARRRRWCRGARRSTAAPC